MAENFIFCYIGVSMFTFPKHKFNVPFILGSFVAIILGRALNIYPLSFLLNLGRKSKIGMNVQHMMFLSGLRGAIAFALAIRNTLSESRQMILTTTLIIVMVTVIFCGGSTLSLLTWLGIPLGVEEDESHPISSPGRGGYDSVAGPSVGGGHIASPLDDRSPAPLGGQQPEREPPGGVPDKSWLAKLWSGFDCKYMKPLLTHASPTLMETLPACCYPLARVLTSQEQLENHPSFRDGGFSRQNSSVSAEEGVSKIASQSSDESDGGGGGGGDGYTVHPRGKTSSSTKPMTSHI